MRTVEAYELDRKFTKLEMPVFAQVLGVGYNGNGGYPSLWVDQGNGVREEKKTIRTFLVLRTGEPVPDALGTFDYIGTAQGVTAGLHVFEVNKDPKM